MAFLCAFCFWEADFSVPLSLSLAGLWLWFWLWRHTAFFLAQPLQGGAQTQLLDFGQARPCTQPNLVACRNSQATVVDAHLAPRHSRLSGTTTRSAARSCDNEMLQQLVRQGTTPFVLTLPQVEQCLPRSFAVGAAQAILPFDPDSLREPPLLASCV